MITLLVLTASIVCLLYGICSYFADRLGSPAFHMLALLLFAATVFMLLLLALYGAMGILILMIGR